MPYHVYKKPCLKRTRGMGSYPSTKSSRPAGKRFVLIIQTHHASPASGHPGTLWRYDLLQGRYWWPIMRRHINKYITSDLACMQAEVPRSLPAGKHLRLPIPQRPLSHVSIDFITDLPTSQGHTIIHLSNNRPLFYTFNPMFNQKHTKLKTAQATGKTTIPNRL